MRQTSLQYLRYSLMKAQDKIDSMLCDLPDADEDEEDYVDASLGTLDETYEEIKEVQGYLMDALWGSGGYREVVRMQMYGE